MSKITKCPNCGSMINTAYEGIHCKESDRYYCKGCIIDEYCNKCPVRNECDVYLNTIDNKN